MWLTGWILGCFLGTAGSITSLVSAQFSFLPLTTVCCGHWDPKFCWLHNWTTAMSWFVMGFLPPPTLSFHFYPFLAHAGLGHNFLPCVSYMATLLSLGFSVVLISSANAFQLLDVGAPRTGTQSMYAAFKMLGLKPRHSGYDLTSRDALSCWNRCWFLISHWD